MPLEVDTTAPDFTLKDQNGQPVTLSATTAARRTCCWCSSRWRSPASARASSTRSATTCREYENDDTATLAISVGPPPTHKVWATESGFTFPVLSDFWPHGAVAQAYGVFNDERGLRQPRHVRRRPRRGSSGSPR